MNVQTRNIEPLREFVVDFTRLIDTDPNEATILDKGKTLLAKLLERDDWLADEFARPHPQYYQQYLLHSDPLERFCVVSFVWGPGQKTPIHNHTVWGLVGVLRGSEGSLRYARNDTGKLVQIGGPEVLQRGQIDAVSPSIGDIHEVSNNEVDQESISIHVYGANIGAVGREVYSAETGEAKPFVSGYSSAMMPNLWDRSVAMRAMLEQ